MDHPSFGSAEENSLISIFSKKAGKEMPAFHPLLKFKLGHYRPGAKQGQGSPFNNVGAVLGQTDPASIEAALLDFRSAIIGDAARRACGKKRGVLPRATFGFGRGGLEDTFGAPSGRDVRLKTAV